MEMNRRTPVFIVTSPRQRVGKTLLARVLTEFFHADGRSVAAYDANPDQFSLVEYLPADTAVASVEDTRGQMMLLDQLVQPDRKAKVVDLGHSQFDRFFSVIHHIGFMREARANAIVPIVLFICDPDARALQGYTMLQSRFPDLALVPVFNEGVGPTARYRSKFPPTRFGGSRSGRDFRSHRTASTQRTRRRSCTAGSSASSWNSAISNCGCCWKI
jgi:hypothetical protein